MKTILFTLIVVLSLTAISLAANPQVTLQISGAVNGTIVLELYPDKAPVTVANFINYVKTGFYNGLIFHRVTKANIFVVQGGGFDSNLVQKTPNTDIINESYNGLSNLRGTLAMARQKGPNTANSQFYINYQNNISLNYGYITLQTTDDYYKKVGYCVFGQVISGMNVVDAISALPTTNDIPDNDVTIQSAVLSGPVCIEKLLGDIDGNCVVDFHDMSLLAQNWLKSNSLN